HIAFKYPSFFGRRWLPLCVGWYGTCSRLEALSLFLSLISIIMTKQFSNTMTISIDAPATAVWQALTDPAMIREYFFGVDTVGEWEEGNTIVYEGQWQGKKFLGKGKVLQVEDQKLLKHTYWSDMSGLPDKPENYHVITYRLNSAGEQTKLTLTE